MPFPNVATQFKPGCAGGPGRPRGRSVTDRLRELLERSEIGGVPIKGGKQVADLIAEVVVKAALKGNHRFVMLLMDRVDGPPQPAQDDSAEGVVEMTPEMAERILSIVNGDDGPETDDSREKTPLVGV